MAYLFYNHCFSPPIIDNEPSYSNAKDHYDSWKYKLIDHWSSHDILFWLLSELYKLQVQNPATLKLEQFVHTRGCDLKRFSKEEFLSIFPQHGELLYHRLQMKLRSVNDDVWRREMVDYYLRSGSSCTPALQPSEHFNMSYFDQPLPHQLPSYYNAHAEEAAKLWPPIDRQDYESWTHTCILEWTPKDTINYLIHQLYQFNINPSTVNLDRFREINGTDLVKMTLEDFKCMLPECGELLYHQLQPKIRSNLEPHLPWNTINESPVFSRKNCNQPLSYAHKQELSYAHPSCFRWKPEGVFPGGSSDDLVLNLSREHSLSVMSSKTVPSEGTLAESNSQNINTFDHLKSHSSSSKGSFSLLSFTKHCERSEIKIRRDKDLDPSLEISSSVFMKKSTEDCDSSVSHIKDPVFQESYVGDTHIKAEDSSKDSLESTRDLVRTKVESTVENSTLDHGYDSDSRDDVSVDQEKERHIKVKRKPGRPRSKTKAKGKVGRVWEFIRDLIMDPKYNPSVISWEDREKGLFRFRSGDQVAKLWGCKRGNPRMNFENFSRSIRQNYKKGYLLPVEKIRLVYQFGPRSTGWREGDPPTRPVTLPLPISVSAKPETTTTTTVAPTTAAQ